MGRFFEEGKHTHTHTCYARESWKDGPDLGERSGKQVRSPWEPSPGRRYLEVACRIDPSNHLAGRRRDSMVVHAHHSPLFHSTKITHPRFLFTNDEDGRFEFTIVKYEWCFCFFPVEIWNRVFHYYIFSIPAIKRRSTSFWDILIFQRICANKQEKGVILEACRKNRPLKFHL